MGDLPGRPHYIRPNTTRFQKLINATVGPAPQDMPCLYASDRDLVARPVPWLNAVVMAVSVSGCVVATGFVAPVLRETPITLVAGLLGLSSYATTICVLIANLLFVVLLFWMVVKKPPSRHVNEDVLETRRGSGLFGFALDEELMFRAGCERWNWRERLTSCVAFGFVHIFNLVFPVSVVLFLIVSGAVFMHAYLREYRHSQSAALATLTAAEFHEKYNLVTLVLAILFVTYWLVAAFVF